MELFYHPLAAKDAKAIAGKYGRISDELQSRFWREFDEGIASISGNPGGHHFDASGYRRYNFDKFPYHILFEERLDWVRIIVVRHDHRNPNYGLRRN
jgi:plasmid stabilization system protein ParE